MGSGVKRRNGCHRLMSAWNPEATLVTALILTWSSIVISVPKVLSVFHFSVKVSPYSDLLYLVSRLPTTLLVSVLDEPDVLNSCRRHFIINFKFVLNMYKLTGQHLFWIKAFVCQLCPSWHFHLLTQSKLDCA